MSNIAEPNRQPRILLVDDDSDHLALCSRWLSLSGYHVDGAPGGAAALASLWPARQLAKRPPADLIRVFTHER